MSRADGHGMAAWRGLRANGSLVHVKMAGAIAGYFIGEQDKKL